MKITIDDAVLTKLQLTKQKKNASLCSYGQDESCVHSCPSDGPSVARGHDPTATI